MVVNRDYRVVTYIWLVFTNLPLPQWTIRKQKVWYVIDLFVIWIKMIWSCFEAGFDIFLFKYIYVRHIKAGWVYASACGCCYVVMACLTFQRRARRLRRRQRRWAEVRRAILAMIGAPCATTVESWFAVIAAPRSSTRTVTCPFSERIQCTSLQTVVALKFISQTKYCAFRVTMQPYRTVVDTWMYMILG